MTTVFNYTTTPPFAIDQLDQAIRNSPLITIAQANGPTMLGDALTVTFRTDLPDDLTGIASVTCQPAVLAAIVASNTGVPLTPPPMVLSPTLTQRTYLWTAWKAVKAARLLNLQYQDDGVVYTIYGYDGPEVHLCLIWHGSVPIGSTYTQTQNDLDKTDFETNFKSLGNRRLTAISAAGNPIAELTLSTGIPGSFPLSVISHDLTDRTSWYQKSLQVVTETLTTSDTLTFASVNVWWVDFSDATSTITATSFQVAKRDGSFGKHSDWYVHVYVSGVEVTTGFTVNFAAGTITFASAQVSVTVTATYWHTNGVTNPSEWLAVPPAGKKFTIDHVELQFAKNIVMTGVLRMEIWAGKVLAGPPLAVDSEGYQVSGVHFPDAMFGDPRVPGTGYGQRRFRYRNARDIINAANEGQGFIEPFGELTEPTLVMPFNYVQAFVFDSAVGTLMRIMVENNAELGGELATATFYLTVSNS